MGAEAMSRRPRPIYSNLGSEGDSNREPLSDAFREYLAVLKAGAMRTATVRKGAEGGLSPPTPVGPESGRLVDVDRQSSRLHHRRPHEQRWCEPEVHRVAGEIELLSPERLWCLLPPQSLRPCTFWRHRIGPCPHRLTPDTIVETLMEALTLASFTHIHRRDYVTAKAVLH